MADPPEAKSDEVGADAGHRTQIDDCYALHEGHLDLPKSGEWCRLVLRELGTIQIPSGRMFVTDPGFHNGIVIRVDPGEYRAVVTQLDDGVRGSDVFCWGKRVVYLSLLLAGRTETRRADLTPDRLLRRLGDTSEGSDGPTWACFPVDTGTCCCIDEAAHAAAKDWDPVYPTEKPPSRVLLAFVGACSQSPDAPRAAFCETGLGDGSYLVVGGFDDQGRLAAVHVCFGVIHDEDPAEKARWLARGEAHRDASRRREARQRWIVCSKILGVFAAVVLLSIALGVGEAVATAASIGVVATVLLVIVFGALSR